MAQVDPRVRHQFGGRGPLMAQPFQNPLMRLPAVPNPWAGAVASPGPMSLFVAQAAEQQRRAAMAGRPQQSRPVDPGVAAAMAANPAQGIPWGQIAGQVAPYANQLGRAFADPMAPLQQAFDWANRPQQGNESDLSMMLRNVARLPGRQPFNPNAVFPSIQRDVRKFRDELLQTPNDRERMTRQVFNSMLNAESGNRHTDKNGRVMTSSAGAIGIAQVMPETAPEAAKLAGLPWDENRYRNDPAYNQALGYAYFQQKLKEHKGDYAKAVAAYNAGTGGVNKAVARAAQNGTTWQQEVPNETQGYLQKVLGRMGGLAEAFGAPAPAFDPSPYQNAMGAVDQAVALRNAPISATYNETPIPDRPKPTDFAMPDFAEGDAAFAQTAPKNPFDDPKERRRMQWAGYAKGIGQALAGLQGNEGIGTMLMKIGGMALTGRKTGDEQIEAREELFEREMQQFNRALAAREDSQAATSANVLNQNIQQGNQYADSIWQDNAAKIRAKNPVVVGDRLITYDTDPNDPNKVTMNSVNIGNTIAAEALINKANLGIQMGQASAEAGRFAYGHQQTTARTALGMTTQLALAQGDGQASTEGYALGAVQNARSAVQDGSWKEMFGGDQILISGLENSARRRAYELAQIPMRPSEDPLAPPVPQIPLDNAQQRALDEKFEEAMTSTIFEAVAKAGTIDKLYNSPTGRRARMVQKSRTLRESQRTNAKGQTSFGSTWDAE